MRPSVVLHNLFSRIDRDKDGQISVVELRKAMTGRHKVRALSADALSNAAC